MPHGFGGLDGRIIGVNVVNGIEVIAVTSGETKDPVKAHPAGVRPCGCAGCFSSISRQLAIVVPHPLDPDRSQVGDPKASCKGACSLGHPARGGDHEKNTFVVLRARPVRE